MSAESKRPVDWAKMDAATAWAWYDAAVAERDSLRLELAAERAAARREGARVTLPPFDPRWANHKSIGPCLGNSFAEYRKEAERKAERRERAFKTGYMVASTRYLAACWRAVAAVWAEAERAHAAAIAAAQNAERTE